MTTQEMIHVLTAYQKEKEIEFKDKASSFWSYTYCPVWNFPSVDYRVKPEVKERKFKLIKEFPFSPPLSTIVEFKTEKDFGDGIYDVGALPVLYLSDLTNYPEFWEEVVEEKEKIYTYWWV